MNLSHDLNKGLGIDNKVVIAIMTIKQKNKKFILGFLFIHNNTTIAYIPKINMFGGCAIPPVNLTTTIIANIRLIRPLPEVNNFLILENISLVSTKNGRV